VFDERIGLGVYLGFDPALFLALIESLTKGNSGGIEG